MEKILIAEDDVFVRNLTLTILQTEGYEVVSVSNGHEALEIFEQFSPDLIISDISMPEMDGFALLEAVRAQVKGVVIPFLFMSGHTERCDVHHARQLGVDDYLFKPFGMKELLDAVRIRLERRKAVLLFDTREAHLQTVMMLANVIEARDAYTRGHIERVRNYALSLGRTFKWSQENLFVLEYGAILHDIGKIIVPKKLLNKTGPLTTKEKSLIHQHTEAGARMLKDITHLQAVIPYVLYHHERWDGTGYPAGLSGAAIPLEGRLMAILDAFDAIASNRPYRNGMSKQVALEEIHCKSGSHFDPDIVTVFLNLSLELP